MWKMCYGTLLVVFAGFLSTGCEFHGGGRLLSAADDGTYATFAVNAVVNENQQTVHGNAQYQDRSEDVRLHAELGNLEACDGPAIAAGEELRAELLQSEADANQVGLMFGTYRPQPTNRGAQGCLIILVVDLGEPGAGNDKLFIKAFSGIFAGYWNFGWITNGNIQVRPIGES